MTHILRTFWSGSTVNKLIQNSGRYLSNGTVTKPSERVGKSLLRPGAMPPASSTELLADVQRQLPQLSAHQLLHALRKLATLDCNVAFNDPTFQSLCEAFANRARGLNAHQLVQAAHALARLRAPADSRPVAVTLQLLRCQLDQLSVRQITRLDNTLKQFDEIGGHSHLVDAFKEALPLAFSMRLPLEFDPDDLHFLGETLAYACSRAPHPICIERSVDALLERKHMLSPRVTIDVLTALSDVDCSKKLYPERARLVRVCEDRLARSLPDLVYGEVARLVDTLQRPLRHSNGEYYHDELIDAIGLYAANCEKLWQVLKLAQVVWAARHVHRPLAARLNELVEREREAITAIWPSNLVVLLECLADAQTAVPVDVLKQLAGAAFSARPGDWIRINVALAALGHRDDILVRRALSPRALEYASGGNRARVLAQWEQAALGGGGARPREECTPLILTELARELGGEDLVARDIRLSGGVVADGVVCVAAGRVLPIELNTGEKLNTPPSALVVCVLVLPDEWYSRNGLQARAAARLMESSARATGRAVLTVSPAQWASTVPRERGPLMARALRDLCAGHGMSLQLHESVRISEEP